MSEFDVIAIGSGTGWDEPRFDRDFRKLGMPFFMAPINARNVRRSLALSGRLPCSYAEAISLGALLKAGWLWMSRGFGYFIGAPIPLSPKSGQGPPEWLRRAGKFRVVLKATSAIGEHTTTVEVQGRGDPGYLATSKMLGERHGVSRTKPTTAHRHATTLKRQGGEAGVC